MVREKGIQSLLHAGYYGCGAILESGFQVGNFIFEKSYRDPKSCPQIKSVRFSEVVAAMLNAICNMMLFCCKVMVWFSEVPLLEAQQYF